MEWIQNDFECFGFDERMREDSRRLSSGAMDWGFGFRF